MQLATALKRTEQTLSTTVQSIPAPDGELIITGSIGSTYLLDFAQGIRIQLAVTLTADCVITVANHTAGCTAELWLTQDDVGGRALYVSDGTTPQPVALPGGPGTLGVVRIVCPDDTNINVTGG